jgi:hypothetical protein
VRRLRRVATLALLAIAGGSPLGCGNKTPVRPPGLIQPRPATALTAHSTPSGVALNWRRPVTYSGGGRMNDLGGFDIDRAPAGGGPEDYLRVGTLTLDDQERFRQERNLEWTDTTAVPDTRYSYRVTAFTLDGYRSVPAGPVEVQFSPSKAPAEAPKKKAKPGAPAQVDHSGSGQ